MNGDGVSCEPLSVSYTLVLDLARSAIYTALAIIEQSRQSIEDPLQAGTFVSLACSSSRGLSWVSKSRKAKPMRPRATAVPAVYEPAPWSVDPDDLRVTPDRRAEFWTARTERRLSCELCYRNCAIADGEAGWCKIRKNEGGVMQLAEHGVIGNMQPAVMHLFNWRNHARSAWVSGVGCTSACSFCTSTRLALAPERMEWAYGERQVGQDGGWAYRRAMLHPKGVISLAKRWDCSAVYLGANEPMLTYEFSWDTARLAKQAGLYVHMDTNGFSSVPAIRAIAPFMDLVRVGIKGHADPEFYKKRMRAEGAVPHVLAAAKAWNASPAILIMSDVVAPPHWVDEAAAIEQMRRFYGWIADELGPLTPLELRGMIRPELHYGDWFQALLPRDRTDADLIEFIDRLHLAEAIAAESGLKYVYTDEHRSIACHHCGGELVGKIGWVAFDLHVTPDGHCEHCGGAVPVTGISKAEYAAIQAEDATEQSKPTARDNWATAAGPLQAM